MKARREFMEYWGCGSDLWDNGYRLQSIFLVAGIGLILVGAKKMGSWVVNMTPAPQH